VLELDAGEEEEEAEEDGPPRMELDQDEPVEGFE